MWGGKEVSNTISAELPLMYHDLPSLFLPPPIVEHFIELVTARYDERMYTGSNGKLGGAWERG